MSENKRYYWLKLHENFFEDETIIYIEEQEDGILLSNLYLKLALKSLRDNGKLLRVIGQTTMPYDTKSLARLTGVNESIVERGIKLFQDIGLIEIATSDEIYLTQLNEMVGSECSSAQRVRKTRAKKAQEEVLHCNNGVTKCNTDKDKDKDKEYISSSKNIIQEDLERLRNEFKMN